MKVLVESWSKEFNKFVPKIRRTAIKVGRFLGLKNSYLEIYLVADAFMKKNVLAFPAPKNFPRPDIPGKTLGEIYLNPDYIKRNSENLLYMVIHGFLHLLGYDHKKEGDRIRMEKMEQKLLRLIS